MKKIISLFVSIISIACLFSCSLFKLDINDLADQLFTSYMGDDFYAWNLLTENASSYGFKRNNLEAKWYSYTEISDEDISKSYSSFKVIKNILDNFNTSSLSSDDLITYNSMYYFIDFYCDFYNQDNGCDSLMNLTYIDSYGGYVASFASMVESYHLRNENDITDLLSYIRSTEEAFPTYYEYAVARKEKNYTISQLTINNMLDYLRRIVSKGESYYLFDIVDNKINNIDFLDATKKNEYRSQAKQLLKDNYFNGINNLIDLLATYEGKKDNTYLSSYGEGGKNVYKISLEHRLGYLDIDMDSYANYLNSKILDLKFKLNLILSQNQDNKEFIKYIEGENKLTNLANPTDMLEYLKKFAKGIVPDLKSEPNISISYLDDTVAQNTNVVAYYTKSPIDSTSDEYITLNPNYLGDTTEALVTLAHEGYPGHLYDYNYAKQLNISNFAKINGCVGRGEGFAVYVEYKLYEYLGSEIGTEAALDYALYQAYTMLLGYAVQTYIDYLIVYDNYNTVKIATYLSSIGLNSNNAETIYNRLVEMPTEYASYGYGSLFMIDLHDSAYKKLGSYYNEVTFNKAILNLGWSPLECVSTLV